MTISMTAIYVVYTACLL